MTDISPSSQKKSRTTFAGGRPADHPPFMETHRSAYTFKERNNINSLHKKTFTKSLGGHGPRGPSGYATGPAWDRLQAMQHGPRGWDLPLPDKAKPEDSRWFEFRVSFSYPLPT